MTPRALTAARMRSVFGEGAAARAAELPELRAARSVFLVTGRSSFERLGAGAGLGSALAGRRVVRFAGVRPNPTVEQVRDAAARGLRSILGGAR